MPCASCGDGSWRPWAFGIELAQWNRRWSIFATVTPGQGYEKRAAGQAASVSLRFGVSEDPPEIGHHQAEALGLIAGKPPVCDGPPILFQC
jgi:hypothetical protein